MARIIGKTFVIKNPEGRSAPSRPDVIQAKGIYSNKNGVYEIAIQPFKDEGRLFIAPIGCAFKTTYYDIRRYYREL